MKNNIAVTLTLFVSLLCLSASAWMPAPPPGYHPPTLFTVDPTDTNGYSAFVGPSSGMFVTEYSTNYPACAPFISWGISYTSTNIFFNDCTLIRDLPAQTTIFSNQYLFALYPSNYVAFTTNTPVFIVSAWNTFTNAGVVFTLTNSLTVSLMAGQGVYTACITDANLDDPNAADWTNNLCAPVATVESRFSSTSYTAFNNWYIRPNAAPWPPFLFAALYWGADHDPLFGGGSHMLIYGTPNSGPWQLMDTTTPYLPPSIRDPSVWNTITATGLTTVTLDSIGRGTFVTTSLTPLWPGDLLQAKIVP